MNISNNQYFYVPSEEIIELEYKNILNNNDKSKFRQSLEQYESLIDSQLNSLNNAKQYISKYRELLNKSILGDDDLWLQIEYNKNPNLSDDTIEIIKLEEENIYLINTKTINFSQIRSINENVRELILETNNKNYGNKIKLRILFDITNKNNFDITNKKINIIKCNRPLEMI